MYQAFAEKRLGFFPVPLTREKAKDILPGIPIQPEINGEKVDIMLHQNGTTIGIRVGGQNPITVRVFSGRGLPGKIFEMCHNDQKLINGGRDVWIASPSRLASGVSLKASNFRPEQFKRGNGRLVKIRSAV